MHPTTYETYERLGKSSPATFSSKPKGVASKLDRLELQLSFNNRSSYSRAIASPSSDLSPCLATRLRWGAA